MSKEKKQDRGYIWGDNCRAWVLQASPNFIIKEELMPAGTAESLHLHLYTEQYFYVLTGKAHFVIDGHETSVVKEEGINIPAGTVHKISNPTNTDLRFLVISAPGNSSDRVEIES